MKYITVAAGIIYNSEQEILIARRPEGKPSAGLWEFPGGKVELGENPGDTLVRELKEELAITATEYSPYLQLEFTYPDRHIDLHIFKVTQFHGEPKDLEQQELRWVKTSDLQNYQFLEANKSIIQKLISSS